MKSLYSLFVLVILNVASYSSNAQCNNVITNGDAESGISNWNFSTGSGSTWVTQSNSYGNAFVASYAWCTMNQTVDLFALGYTSQQLNQQPQISYMQMFKGHTVNYADFYYFKIELKNSSNQVIASYNLGSQGSPVTTTANWDTVSGVFSNYGSGLRYVKIDCGGKDVEYWAGNYGTIIDNTIVSVEDITNVNICSGTYVFNGQTLNSSGTYTGSFTGQYGCDSNVILNLHIGAYTIDDTLHFCEGDSYVFNGNTYTSSASVSGSFTSYAGCDSNVTHALVFHSLFDDTIHAGICPGDVYHFGAQNLFNPGYYSGSFTSMYGCDSNVILDLYFNPSQFNSVTHYLCPGDTYNFGGTSIYSPGSYFGSFTNVYGCDSLISLSVVMDQSYNEQSSIELCGGDTVFFGSQVITESGSYTEHFFTYHGGCDSIVTFNAHVTWIDNVVSVGTSALHAIDTNSASTFQWLNCNLAMFHISGATASTFVPTSGGNFAVEITNGQCKDTSDCYLYTPQGIVETVDLEVSVSPNPSKEFISVVSGQGLQTQSLMLIDGSGKVVLHLTYNDYRQIRNIDVSNYESGIYQVVIGTNKGEFYKKIAIIP